MSKMGPLNFLHHLTTCTEHTTGHWMKWRTFDLNILFLRHVVIYLTSTFPPSWCRSWPMETWIMNGWGTNGCPAWVCPSTAPTSWSHWWTRVCSTTWPRKNWGASWRWWIVSTGLKERSVMLFSSCLSSPFLLLCCLWPLSFEVKLAKCLSHLQSESALRNHVLEAPKLRQEGAGEEEGWEPTSEPG